MRTGQAPNLSGGNVTYFSVFPEDVFTLTVDPAAMRASVAPHRRLHTLTTDAVHEMSRLTASHWTGAEGDLYRARVKSFLEAPTAMASALETAVRQVESFAAAAEQARQKMAALAAAARTTHEALRQESLRQLSLQGSAGTGRGAPPPPTHLPGPYVPCTPVSTQALFDQQVASAQRIKEELAAAARAAAAAVSGIPAPPPVPISTGALTSEQLDAAQEDVVVRRDTVDMSYGVAYRSLLGRQGLKVQMETLENGRIKVTVLRKDEVGVAGDAPSGAAEGALETTQGVTYQVTRSELPALLMTVAASYAATKRLPPPLKGGGYIQSVGVNGSLEGAAAKTEHGSVSKGANVEEAVTTQMNTDGSMEVSWSGEMSVDDSAEAEIPAGRGAGAAPRTPGPTSAEGSGRHVTIADAAGPAAAVSVKVVARPDGTNSITTTVRRTRGADPATPGWKVRKTRVVEDVTTRVVSAAETKAIMEEVRDPRRRGEAISRIKRIAMESAGAAEGPEVQRHRYEYEVEKLELGGGIETDGPVTGVEAEEEAGRETLVSKDGRSVKRPS